MNVMGPRSSEHLILMFENMLLEYQYCELEARDTVFSGVCYRDSVDRI